MVWAIESGLQIGKISSGVQCQDNKTQPTGEIPQRFTQTTQRFRNAFRVLSSFARHLCVLRVRLSGCSAPKDSLPMDDLNDLAYFAHVAERLCRCTERATGIPKSKLSRRIAELEARLGVRLINAARGTCRHRHRPAHAAARAMLAGRRRAGPGAAGDSGAARRGAPTSCPPALLQHAVSDMLALSQRLAAGHAAGAVKPTPQRRWQAGRRQPGAARAPHRRRAAAGRDRQALGAGPHQLVAARR